MQCCDVRLEVGARAECEEAAAEADSHLPCDQQWRRRSGFREVTSDLGVCGFVVASGSYAQTHELSVASVFEKVSITIRRVSGLPVCMSAPWQCLGSVQVRSGYRIPWTCSPVALSHPMSVRDGRASRDLTTELSLRTVFLFLKNCHGNCIQYTILKFAFVIYDDIFLKIFFGFSLILFL